LAGVLHAPPARRRGAGLAFEGAGERRFRFVAGLQRDRGDRARPPLPCASAPVALLERCNTADGASLVVPSEYLDAVIVKRSA
jgi:hypothetical protein